MKEIINKTCEILNSGGIILYPTDTIWGIGCDATNDEAVDRIFNLKSRATNKSMLILVDGIEMLKSYIQEIPEIALQLITSAQRPLTIIYPGAKGLSSKLIPTDGTIGVRIPNHDFCINIIKAINKPIVSTSANISGGPNPLGFFDINNQLKENVDYIVPIDLEKFSPHRSSDIIKVNLSGKVEIIR